MAGFSDALYNEMLAVFAGEASVTSLHSDDPGDNGSHELTGGGYTRAAVTWSTPSNGAVTATTTLEFDVPSATLVSHVGFWDSSDTWLGSVELAEPELFTGAGSIELDPVTISLDN